MRNSLSNNTDKLQIEYPCNWQYTIIGSNHEEIKNAIDDISGLVPVTITYSHSSSGQKYHSYIMEIEVQDNESRLSLFQSLQNHPHIKFVI